MPALTRISKVLRSREGSVVVVMALMAASASLFAILTSRWLGPADRGVVVIAATTGSLLMLVGSLGVGTGGRVLLGRSPGLPLRDYLRAVAQLGSLHVATAATLGLGILWIANSLDDPFTAVLFVPYAVLLLLAYLLREGLHGLGRHRSAVLGDVATTSIQTVMVLCTQFVALTSLRMVLLSMVIGQGVQVLIHARTLNILAPSRRRLASFASSCKSPRAIVRFSISAMPAILGQAFVIRGDRLMLGAMAGSSAVGIYGAAATFTELLWLIASGVGQVAFKRSTQTNDGRSSDTQRRWTLGLTAGGCAALAATAPLLVPMFLGSAFEAAVPLVWILSIAALPMASYQIDVSILNGLGRMRSASASTAAGSVALAAFCFISIPRFGAMGAAVGSVIAYSIMAVVARRAVLRATAVAG